MKLSIVTTLYQSAPYIDEFYRRATEAAKTLSDEYEIVIVNDGSPDESLARAVRLAELDSHVIVIDLSRNFGHHKAMMTGLSHAHARECISDRQRFGRRTRVVTELFSADGAGQMRCCLRRAGTT